MVAETYSFFSKDTLDIATDLFTIFGVGFAIYIYRQWRNDFKTQKAYEYAMEMLRKLYHLHGQIEALRSPKFYFRETIYDDINNKLIPAINDLIAQTATLQTELIVAKDILVKASGILNEFNNCIVNQIIKKIRTATYMFNWEIKKDDKKVHETQLWEILFPAECMEFSEIKFKPSMLGTDGEIVNDEFNQTIEKNFKIIYALLCNELALTQEKPNFFKKCRAIWLKFSNWICKDCC